MEYMESRLEIAGMPKQSIFSEEMMAEIHLRSQGIPRLINLICEHSLILGYVEQTQEVSAEMINSVAKDLELEMQSFLIPPNEVIPESRLSSGPGEPSRPIHFFGRTAERQVR